jgi:SagB-type dehydrogenase family enzyme
MQLTRPALALCVTTLLLGAQEAMPLKLPPVTGGGATLYEALAARKTVRTLGGPGLSLAEAGQLLWAAQGENRPGRRTVPSAKAKYPLELYLVTAGASTLPAGLYHYESSGHLLKKLAEGGPQELLGRVKGMQPWIPDAPAVFVLAGVPTRIDPTGKGNAVPFTYYEGGAAAQCLLLQAAALGLGAGTAGGVDMEAVGQALKLPAGTQAMILLPVGREKGSGS